MNRTVCDISTIQYDKYMYVKWNLKIMTKCVYRDLWQHFLSCSMLPYRTTRYTMNSPSPPNTAHETDSQATLRGSSRNRMWRSVVVGMATVVVSIITIVMAAESDKRVEYNYKVYCWNSQQYSSSPRATLFPEANPREIALLEGNWNIADPLNGIL